MNRTKKITRIIGVLALSLTAFSAAFGQQPRVIGRTYKESKPAWEPLPQAPRGAPNVIYLVLDDVGYAQLGCYGSEIQTPNLDRLAANGLRYTNFHTTALCSPSRAALLTGHNHHSNHLGVIAEAATGYPGYDGRVPKSHATVAEILKQSGYSTFYVGKWHLTNFDEYSNAGPFERWPHSVAATEALAAGAAKLRMEFTKTGDNQGVATLFINDRKVGEGPIARTVPLAFNLSEGLTAGRDPSTPVSENYQSPYTFTGKLKKVVFQVKEEAKTAAQ